MGLADMVVDKSRQYLFTVVLCNAVDSAKALCGFFLCFCTQLAQRRIYVKKNSLVSISFLSPLFFLIYSCLLFHSEVVTKPSF